MDIPFSRPELQEKYYKIIDAKIKEYDSNLNEIFPLTEDDYDIDMLTDMYEFCKIVDNRLDTTETNLYKVALELDTTIHLLYRDIEGNIDYTFRNVNPLELTSMEDILRVYKEMNPFLSLDEFIEGMVWESTDIPPEDVIGHFGGFLDLQNTRKEDWDQKISEWKQEDIDNTQRIYNRQMNLLMNSVQRDISINYEQRLFTIKNRELAFKARNIENAKSFSIFDKFISSSATSKVPFIKLSSISTGKLEEVYKIYTQSTREAVNDWISKDEKIEEDSPFKTEDYIYYLIVLDKKCYIECYLSSEALVVKIPSSYGINVIEKIIYDNTLSIFEMEIFDYREKSIQMDTYLDNFPAIDPALLQFYLLSNPNSSIYFKEAESYINKEKRKFRLNYKPISDVFIQEYIVEYEKTNAKRMLIKAPDENSCIDFFVNIFGRTIQGFLLRQTAISEMFTRIIYGENYILEVKQEKKDKKKKASSIVDQHLYTKKNKIDHIKSIINLPDEYSRYCLCPRQPSILSKEEADAWLETGDTIFNKKASIEDRKDIKGYTLSDGRTIYFTCPNDEYREIHLIRETKSKDQTYVLSPCCWFKKWEEKIDPSNIVMAAPSSKITGRPTEISGDSIKKYSFENIDKADNKGPDYMFLSQDISHLLSYMYNEGENIDQEFYLVKPKKVATKNNFIEAILMVLDESLYSSSDYRTAIANKVDPMVFAQEAIGIEKDPETLLEEFGDRKIILDSKVHYRAIEEYFGIHIFVFEMGDPDIVVNGLEYNFNIEIPKNKIFCNRVLYKDRPCIILIRNRDEYNAIYTGDSGLYNPTMSSKLMDLFNYSHEISFETNDGKIAKNLFSAVNWVEFFGSDSIIAQEIDIAGKTRVLQTQSGIVMVVPPTQPLNVPLIQEYTAISPKRAIDLFGTPKTWDERGFWYPLMEFDNQIYVLTSPHDLGLPSEDLILNSPLNLFIPKVRKSFEFFNYIDIKKAAFALIQLIQWGWRVDRRPSFKTWFTQFLQKVSEPTDILTMIPDTIQLALPQDIEDARDGFSLINLWWPQIFTPTGNLKLWDPLVDYIFQFFDREETIMKDMIIDPISTSLVGFYNTAEDYPSKENVRVFISREGFQTWARIERNREENPILKIYNTFQNKCINDIISKVNPVRIGYRNHWVMVSNIEDRTYDSAVKASYGWKKNGKISSENIPDDSRPQIVTLAFAKNYDLVEVNATDFTEHGRIYVLKYPNNTYASILSE